MVKEREPRRRRRERLDWEAIAVMAEIRRRRMVPAIRAATGLKLHSIYRWKVVPLYRVVEVEAATGIPRERLRPDFHRVVLIEKVPPKLAEDPPLLAAE
jgi:hypothetical protein